MDKQELAALQDAVAHEKENVRQVEASGVEASRQLEAAKRAEREMEAVLHAQARAARLAVVSVALRRPLVTASRLRGGVAQSARVLAGLIARDAACPAVTDPRELSTDEQEGCDVLDGRWQRGR